MAVKKIDPVLKSGLDALSKAYTDSPATTKAGIWARIIVKIIPLGTLIDMLVHKSK